MKIIYSIFLLCFVLVSCNKKTEFTPKVYHESSAKECKSDYNCANINIEVIEATNKRDISNFINATIFDSIKNAVYIGENPNEVENYTDLTHSFVSLFTKLKSELKQDKIPSWEASTKTKVGYQSNKMLNVVIDYYVFTGGAHGYGAVRSLLFDAKTGKILPLSEIFSDIEKVKSLAETKFRKQEKIAQNTSLNDAGYFFDKNIFVLPRNIMFTKNGLSLYYNQYEVASYANGPIEIELLYEEVKPYLLIQ